ncbi:MAG: carboxylating nicotinate-nucleotide diphosphorylase [Nitrospiraceae bacterium]|nr:MAG: carboxylating nicotinate-nucleotide diphosphorylase [Nitrospiraceae bacterium]
MNNTNFTDKALLNALHEDIGNGDVTTSSLIPVNHVSNAVIIAKGNFIVAGLPFAERVFQLMDTGVEFKTLKKDGSRVKPKDVIAKVSGRTQALLMAERTALNLMQRLSGIATLTDKYVRQVKGIAVKIVDTRKTAPGLRYFDKYAVRTGGGHNHRYGLFDGVLIKDNHIAAAGGVRKAVNAARSHVHQLMKIEVEVKDIREAREAVSAGADIIMLDNMNIAVMKKAVEVIRSRNSRIVIEASGNVTPENVCSISETGVDIISVGALTHSAPAADISFKISQARR